MGHDVLLAKPETFMNLSGLSVAALLQELELGVEDLIVLYDELAIPLGTLRIRERGSAGGHNGVKSISGCLARRSGRAFGSGLANRRSRVDARSSPAEGLPAWADAQAGVGGAG